jgi:hypothetical protein
MLLLVATFPCLYRSVELGVTAEEGLKYSIPSMRGSAGYSADFNSTAESDFRDMDRSGDRWGDVALVLFFCCLTSASVGLWMLRSTRRAATQ